MKKAESYLGLTTVPTGSTNVIFNTDYYGEEVSDPYCLWCVVFIWDIFRMCGCSQLFYNGEKTNACKDVYIWAEENNLIIPSDKGEYGDIAIYKWGEEEYSHIGLVYKNNCDNSYTTYEGNTTPVKGSKERGVYKKIRYMDEIQCIIRPPYNR